MSSAAGCSSWTRRQSAVLAALLYLATASDCAGAQVETSASRRTAQSAGTPADGHLAAGMDDTEQRSSRGHLTRSAAAPLRSERLEAASTHARVGRHAAVRAGAELAPAFRGGASVPAHHIHVCELASQTTKRGHLAQLLGGAACSVCQVCAEDDATHLGGVYGPKRAGGPARAEPWLGADARRHARRSTCRIRARRDALGVPPRPCCVA
jgi:hypothetical protein